MDTAITSALISALVSLVVTLGSFHWKKSQDRTRARSKAAALLRILSWEFQEYEHLTRSPIAIQLDLSTLFQFFSEGHHETVSNELLQKLLEVWSVLKLRNVDSNLYFAVANMQTTAPELGREAMEKLLEEKNALLTKYIAECRVLIEDFLQGSNTNSQAV